MVDDNEVRADAQLLKAICGDLKMMRQFGDNISKYVARSHLISSCQRATIAADCDEILKENLGTQPPLNFSVKKFISLYTNRGISGFV